MCIDSLIAISNALSVSTDAILFGEITYDKKPYYKEFADIMLDCSDNEKTEIIEFYGHNSRKISCDYYIDDRMLLPEGAKA